MTTRRGVFPVLYIEGAAPRQEMRLWPRSIPLTLIEPWRKQLEANHNRTLESLAKSGGLTPVELWLGAHGKQIGDYDEISIQVAARWLIAELAKDTH